MKKLENERVVIYIKRDEYFSEMMKFVDEINETSMTKPSLFLKHLLYRGWKDFQKATGNDATIANVDLIKTEDIKDEKNWVSKEKPKKEKPAIKKMSKLGV